MDAGLTPLGTEGLRRFQALQPLVDDLRWLDSVLAARGIPMDYVARSLDWLEKFAARDRPCSSAVSPSFASSDWPACWVPMRAAPTRRRRSFSPIKSSAAKAS